MKREGIVNLLILLGVVLLDRITKYYLQDGCLGIFCIKRAFNTGASFGIFPGMTIMLVVIAIVVLVLMAFYYERIGRALRLSFVLIGAGTIGNLVDRLFFGGVIDLFRIWNSSSFNMADLSNLAGGIILVYFLIKKDKKPHKK